uniref:Uncharacterized protein n=1 Tax=Amphimedon queenslandica TaxID=400682 RepID=A0A1X7VIC7_AMPQE
MFLMSVLPLTIVPAELILINHAPSPLTPSLFTFKTLTTAQESDVKTTPPTPPRATTLIDMRGYLAVLLVTVPSAISSTLLLPLSLPPPGTILQGPVLPETLLNTQIIYILVHTPTPLISLTHPRSPLVGVATKDPLISLIPRGVHTVGVAKRHRLISLMPVVVQIIPASVYRRAVSRPTVTRGVAHRSLSEVIGTSRSHTTP